MAKTYRLFAANTPCTKFPCATPSGNYDVLRFTAPNQRQPLGTVVLKSRASGAVHTINQPHNFGLAVCGDIA